LRELPDDRALERVGVLELVDQDVVVRLPQVLADARELLALEQAADEREDAVEGDVARAEIVGPELAGEVLDELQRAADERLVDLRHVLREAQRGLLDEAALDG